MLDVKKQNRTQSYVNIKEGMELGVVGDGGEYIHSYTMYRITQDLTKVRKTKEIQQ